MGKFIVTGKLNDRELSLIRRDTSLYKHNIAPAMIYSSGTGFAGVDRESRDCLVFMPDTESAKRTYNILQSIVIEHYSYLGFNISNVSELQYARYDVGGKFNWHGDILPSNTGMLRGFTLSVQITDPDEYDGGSLQLNDHGEIVTIDTTPGTYTVFPSYTKHQVSPVTRGFRESIVAWVYMTPQEIEWLQKNDK